MNRFFKVEMGAEGWGLLVNKGTAEEPKFRVVLKGSQPSYGADGSGDEQRRSRGQKAFGVQTTRLTLLRDNTELNEARQHNNIAILFRTSLASAPTTSHGCCVTSRPDRRCSSTWPA